MKLAVRRRLQIHHLKIPVTVATVLVFIYLFELFFAGSIEYAAAYGFLSRLPPQYDPVLRFLAPFLHSNHDHIVWNIGIFLLLSVLILPHEHPRDFLVIFVASAWFSASVMTWILGGGLGFGISGANAALAGWETIYRLREMTGVANDIDSPLSKRYAVAVMLFTLPATLAILNIGQGFGLVQVKEGVSIAGHFSGALFGLVYGSYDWVRISFEGDIKLPQ